MKLSDNLKFSACDKKSIPAGGRHGIGYVYLISDRNIVKIGKSQKPKMRIETILGAMKIKTPKIFISDAHTNYSVNEKLLHEHFSKERIKGEWFNLDIEKVSNEHYKFPLGNKIIAKEDDTNTKYSPTQVRLHPTTKAFLDLQQAKINKAREKKNKKPLTMDDVIALAIENLTITQGAEK